MSVVEDNITMTTDERHVVLLLANLLLFLWQSSVHRMGNPLIVMNIHDRTAPTRFNVNSGSSRKLRLLVSESTKVE